MAHATTLLIMMCTFALDASEALHAEALAALLRRFLLLAYVYYSHAVSFKWSVLFFTTPRAASGLVFVSHYTACTQPPGSDPGGTRMMPTSGHMAVVILPGLGALAHNARTQAFMRSYKRPGDARGSLSYRIVIAQVA